MSENVGVSASRNTKGLHGLYREKFTFTDVMIGAKKLLKFQNGHTFFMILSRVMKVF
jgi:hypothetical protein